MAPPTGSPDHRRTRRVRIYHQLVVCQQRDDATLGSRIIGRLTRAAPPIGAA